MSDLKIQFLYQSLLDSQAIIRALDVKIGFLFAITILPLAGGSHIVKAVTGMISYSYWFLPALVLLFAMWALALYLLYKSLAPLSKIAHLIKKDRDSIFYCSGLFDFGFLDVFFNKTTTPCQSIDSIKESIPEDEDGIISDLCFEKIKLAYIRDIKSKRAAWCLRLTFSWLATGVIMYLIFSLLVTVC